jgi:hypothetical protein
MLTKLFLALRNNRHQVKVIKLNGETRSQLGRSHPEEDNRRANAVRQWGMNPDSPRHQPLATIDEPLPRRTQTILSHQLDAELRERIDSGTERLQDSRKKNLPGTTVQINLYAGDPDDR